LVFLFSKSNHSAARVIDLANDQTAFLAQNLTILHFYFFTSALWTAFHFYTCIRTENSPLNAFRFKKKYFKNVLSLKSEHQLNLINFGG